MLDQKLIRENPTSVEENLSLRGKVYKISHIHDLTVKKKEIDIEISSLQSESKKLSKSIGQLIGKSQNNNPKERLSILDLHLKKRRPSYSFPLSTIIDRTEGFSGAALEQAVIEGMHISFSENRELSEKDLIKAVSELVPLSRTAKEQIDFLKEWSLTGRARSAS